LAGDPDGAATALLEVGRRAVASGALATAAHALARAAELVADDAELAVEIDEVRIEIAALAGNFEQAMGIGGGLLRRLSDPARCAQVHVRIAQAASATASWAAAQEHVTLARDLVAELDQAALAGVDALAAHVLLGAARPEAAEATARRALDAAEPTDLADTACQALEVIGRVARKRDLHKAEAAFTRQLEIATTHGMTVWVLRATHELGAVDLMGSNRVDRLVRARELAAEAGALSVMATVDLQLAGSGVTSLDAAGCLAAARRCQLAARRWHLDLVLAVALLFEGWAHAIAGLEARSNSPSRKRLRWADPRCRFRPPRPAVGQLSGCCARSGTVRWLPTTPPCLRYAPSPMPTPVRTAPNGRSCAPCRTLTATGHATGWDSWSRSARSPTAGGSPLIG